MKVDGHEISEAAVEAGMRIIAQRKPFVAYLVESEVALHLGDELRRRGGVAMRVADRLIQKEKKAGRILFDHVLRMWFQVPPPEEEPGGTSRG